MKKAIKVTIVILAVVVVVIAIRNKILVDRYAGELKLQKEENSSLRQAAKEIQKVLIDSRTASMMYLGQTIELVHLEKIFPGEQPVQPLLRTSRLLLVFSECYTLSL